MMGILYGWKKEYLLENMSFRQIAMYLNYGAEFKWGKQDEGKPKKATDKSARELKAEREKLREQYGIKTEGL